MATELDPVTVQVGLPGRRPASPLDSLAVGGQAAAAVPVQPPSQPQGRGGLNLDMLARVAAMTANPNLPAGNVMRNVAMTRLVMERQRKQQDFMKQVQGVMGMNLPQTDVLGSDGKTVLGKRARIYELILGQPDLAREVLGDDTVKSITTEYFKGADESGLEEIRRRREDRLSRQQEINNLQMYGGTVSDEDLADVGLDLTQYAKAGGAEPFFDENGRRHWRVKPKMEFQRDVAEGKWADGEVEKFRVMTLERDSWGRALKLANDLGIGEDQVAQLGTLEFEHNVASPFGPISLPARFNLARQYMNDPRYTALARELEQAFQAFRLRVTGAQASDRELKTLRTIIPTLRDRPGVFFASIRQLMTDVDENMGSQLQLYKAFGRNTMPVEAYLSGQAGPPGRPVAPGQPGADRFIAGKTYMDPRTKVKKKYLGNGQWGPADGR